MKKKPTPMFLESPETSLKRSLTIKIADSEKDKIKRLAKASGISLEEYVKAVLGQAVEENDVFEVVYQNAKKRQG